MEEGYSAGLRWLTILKRFIRSAGRCDVYMGVGDDALLLAGRTRAEGKLYYLAVK